MPIQRVVAGIALACAMAVAAPQPAFAGLKINLIFVDNAPPASPKIMIGGGQLQEIMQVAAENWERVFKSGNGNWKLTVEYGWAPLVSNLFANERMISEGGTLLASHTPVSSSTTTRDCSRRLPACSPTLHRATTRNIFLTRPMPSTWETDGSMLEGCSAIRLVTP